LTRDEHNLIADGIAEEKKSGNHMEMDVITPVVQRVANDRPRFEKEKEEKSG